MFVVSFTNTAPGAVTGWTQVGAQITVGTTYRGQFYQRVASSEPASYTLVVASFPSAIAAMHAYSSATEVVEHDDQQAGSITNILQNTSATSDQSLTAHTQLAAGRVVYVEMGETGQSAHSSDYTFTDDSHVALRP